MECDEKYIATDTHRWEIFGFLYTKGNETKKEEIRRREKSVFDSNRERLL